MIPRYGGPRAPQPIRLLTRASLRLHSTSGDGEVSQAPPGFSALSNRVRTLMRTTPHPLTSIVAFPPKSSDFPDNRQHTPRGLLVSSFSTITLHPTPYVSFNIKRPSSTLDAIYGSGRFTASGINSTIAADAFARNQGAGKALEHLVGSTGKLKDKADGTWWMACKLVRERSVEVGDHVVVIGEVVGANTYGYEKGRMGLVYAKGKYRKVGKILNVEDEEPTKVSQSKGLNRK